MKRLFAAAALAAVAFSAAAQERVVNVYNWTDYIDPKALDPRAAATLARNRAKHYEELGWTAEDIAENEEITRQIQEKKAAIIAGRRASAS